MKKKILALAMSLALSSTALAGGYGGVTIANVAYNTNYSMEIEVQNCASTALPLTNCGAPYIFNNPDFLRVGQSTTLYTSLDWYQGEITAVLRVILHDTKGKVISETRFNNPYNVTVCTAKSREFGKALDNRVILLSEITTDGYVVCDANGVTEPYHYDANLKQNLDEKSWMAVKHKSIF